MLIKLSENIKNNIQNEYAAFIDKYISLLPPEQSAIYLYCVKSAAEKTINSAEVERAFNLDSKTLFSALKYFSQLGMVEFTDGNAVITGTFSKTLPVNPDNKPEYTSDEIAYVKSSNGDVNRLLTESQRLLGRMLKYNEIQTVYSFYDYYRLPVEVTLILIDYCVKMGKTHLNYIEKAVLNWAENGIDTPEKAYERIEFFNSSSYAIEKAMGIKGRILTPAENEFIKKWQTEYGFKTDMIVLACQKTVIATGKGSFPYADSILKSWHEKGISTDEEAGKEEKEKPKAAAQKPTKTVNQFTNYKQRTYDFKALEKKALEKLHNSQEDK